MSQVQMRECEGCGVRAETPQEMQGWTQVAVGIGSISMQPWSNGWDFCEKCWAPGNTIYDIYMNSPLVQRQITDSMEAEQARLDRIQAAETGMIATYVYPLDLRDDDSDNERPDNNS